MNQGDLRVNSAWHIRQAELYGLLELYGFPAIIYSAVSELKGPHPLKCKIAICNRKLHKTRVNFESTTMGIPVLIFDCKN